MDNTSKVILIIVGILVVVVVAIWYGVSREASPSASAVKKPIKIGLSLPMTGEGAMYGAAGLGGAELAAKEINESGGVQGRQIELVVEDDKCSPEGAIALNKLANVDRVTAIVGPICSPAAGPGVPIVQRAGVPIVLVASAPGLTAAGEYIFRIYPSDALQGKFAANFIYSELGKRKAAVIYVKNDWGQGLKNVFVNIFGQLGGKVVYEGGVLQDVRDMRTLVAQVREADPDVLYFPVYPQGAIVGLKQIKEIGLDVPIVGGDIFVGDELMQLEEAEGVIYIAGKTYNLQEFQDRVKQVTGKSGNAFTPFIYDAIKILAKVIEKVGDEKTAIRDELENTFYTEGVALPLIEFDEKGDLKSAEFDVRIIQSKTSVDYKP